MAESGLIPTERIERAILALRGGRVMLDADLAALYGVPVRSLNQAVRRNSSGSRPTSCSSSRRRSSGVCDHKL